MAQSMKRGTFLALAIVGLSVGCQRKTAPDATSEDTARAKQSCAKYAGYVPADGPVVRAKLEARCAAQPGECPWRKKISEICSFSGPTTSQRYDVITTLSPNDESSRDSLCDAMRDGVVALSTRVDVFCKGGGKPCTKCGVRGGSR
jgi:hypothetical protein